MSGIDKMENLVKGSKGIMDLDLELVPKAFHKEALKQHYKDIEEYYIYQLHLRTFKMGQKYNKKI